MLEKRTFLACISALKFLLATRAQSVRRNAFGLIAALIVRELWSIDGRESMNQSVVSNLLKIAFKMLCRGRRWISVYGWGPGASHAARTTYSCSVGKMGIVYREHLWVYTKTTRNPKP